MMFQVEKIVCLFLLISPSVYGDDGNDYKIESISDTQYIWAHSPFWDESSQTLYFTDIIGQLVNSYKPSTQEIHTAKIADEENANVSVIIPYEGEMDKFLVSVGTTVRKLTWDGASDSADELVLIAEVTQNTTISTHNGRADPMGRLWIGTVGPFARDSDNNPIPDYYGGAVYMVNYDGEVIEKISKVSIPNGLAWSPDKTKLYFTDSWEQQVLVYDYDNESGDISNRRLVFDTKENNLEGLPAGITIDTEGKLWVTLFFSGMVIRIDPDSSELLEIIHVPADQPTNLAFGGENLDTLYVTTGQILSDFSPSSENSGRVLAITGLMSNGKPVTGYPGQKIVTI